MLLITKKRLKHYWYIYLLIFIPVLLVALFSYFALLNAGILAIAWFKAWRLLNLIGFVGTFGIGFAWGLRSYAPELLWSTEPFLILFFLMYLGIGLLFARRKLLDMPAIGRAHV